MQFTHKFRFNLCNLRPGVLHACGGGGVSEGAAAAQRQQPDNNSIRTCVLPSAELPSLSLPLCAWQNKSKTKSSSSSAGDAEIPIEQAIQSILPNCNSLNKVVSAIKFGVSILIFII